MMMLCQNVECERRLKGVQEKNVCIWNFSGLCSQCKLKEVSDIQNNLGVDIVAGQESWEKDESVVSVSIYDWFGKPCKVQNNPRGRGCWVSST